MASQITIIDPSLRRVTIKVTPGKYISEVRDEACTKLRLNSDQYMLKRKDKQVDLSVTYRLSGLPSGATLELVQRSRSPSVVSVALQIPAGLTADGLATRLIGKFPSDKSLWQILRTFESGNVDGSNRIWNFTERSVKTASGSEEVYAFPRLHAMGRDYATIEDLQKTLSQLGFNDGSVLLKLDILPTTKTLQEAKKDMQQYFTTTEASSSLGHGSITNQLSDISNGATATINQSAASDATSSQTTEQPAAASPQTATTISSRPTTVYRPPSSSTPAAALIQPADSDFEPTIDLMKRHQASIAISTRNKRLPTDAELSAASSAAAAKLASVTSIDIKIVFPDQSSVLAPFTNSDTVAGLYAYVRSLLARPQEEFALSYAGVKGLISMREDVDGEKRLIGDFGLVGRVLVRVLWGSDVGLEARQGSSLKDDVVGQAREIEIQKFAEMDVAEQHDGSDGTGNVKAEKKSSGGGGGSKVPKWLKLPGKK